MKQIILLIALAATCNAYSQKRGSIPMLITVNTKGCIKYLDSLLSLKNYPYKIDSLTDSEGNLIISADFPFEERDFYRCANTTLLFMGNYNHEICIKQILAGPIEYGYDNLQLVKQQFTPVQGKPGMWELQYFKEKGIKIMATYTVDTKGFTLVYELLSD